MTILSIAPSVSVNHLHINRPTITMDRPLPERTKTKSLPGRYEHALRRLSACSLIVGCRTSIVDIADKLDILQKTVQIGASHGPGSPMRSTGA